MDSTFVSGFVVGLGVGVVVSLVGIAWLVANASWRKANLAGVSIPILGIVGMRLRGTPPALVIDATVTLAKRGREVDWRQVEAAYLAHGNERMDSYELVEIVDREVTSKGA